MTRQQDLSKIAFLICAAFIAILVARTFVNLPGEIDRHGYFARSHDTPIRIEGNWTNGDSRTCMMVPKPESPAKGKSASIIPPELSDLPMMYCGNDDEFWTRGDTVQPHVLPVRYWGRIERSDKMLITWKCVRKPESLVCKALD